METTTGLNKQTFAAFIAAKRKAAGMTQEELARQLYVTHTTVSKWERGLSYPDIALVPEVCRLLGITEHEFFTACDDLQHRRQKRDAKHWRRLTLIGQGTLCGGYAVALLTCFICNLAVGHRLDWFFIVLTSLLLAFSLTSLPVFLKRERAVISLSAATGSLLLLILTCGLYTGGGWLGAGFSIVAACLALPWGLYAQWRFYPKHRLELSLGILTVWTFGLLAVICLVTGGDWLLRLAFPITAFSYAFVWAVFAVARWTPVNGCIKAGLFTLLAAAAMPGGTWLATALAGPGATGITFASYFHWEGGLLHDGIDGSITGNRLTFVCLLAAALVLLIIGLAVAVSRRKRNHSA